MLDEKYRYTFSIIAATFLTAIATCVIAFVSCKEIEIMKGNLTILNEELKLNQAPAIKLEIGSKRESKPMSGRLVSEEGKTYIGFWYYATNTGNKPAFNCSYFHKISKDYKEDLTISLDKFESRYKKLTFWPTDYTNCGFDTISVKLLRELRQGETLYRYLFFYYQDNSANPYLKRAVWKLDSIEGDSIFSWSQLEERRIEFSDINNNDDK